MLLLLFTIRVLLRIRILKSRRSDGWLTVRKLKNLNLGLPTF